ALGAISPVHPYVARRPATATSCLAALLACLAACQPADDHKGASDGDEPAGGSGGQGLGGQGLGGRSHASGGGGGRVTGSGGTGGAALPLDAASPDTGGSDSGGS